MAKSKDLGSLVGEEASAPAKTQTAVETDSGTTKRPKSGIAKKARSATGRAAVAAPAGDSAPAEDAAKTGEGAKPLFLRLHRKESRFRGDQLDGMAMLSRRLNRARSDKGTTPRITENTLIRVAVDALLELGDELSGDTEQDLLASLRSELRK